MKDGFYLLCASEEVEEDFSAYFPMMLVQYVTLLPIRYTFSARQMFEGICNSAVLSI